MKRTVVDAAVTILLAGAVGALVGFTVTAVVLTAALSVEWAGETYGLLGKVAVATAWGASTVAAFATARTCWLSRKGKW